MEKKHMSSKKLSKDVKVALNSYLKISDKEISEEQKRQFNMLSNLFFEFPTLSIAVFKDAKEKTATSTTTSHNSPADKYLKVRDSRISEIPLMIQPVVSEKKVLAYIINLDSSKFDKLIYAKRFLETFSPKTLDNKNTFQCFVNSTVVRQLNEDRNNNKRQQEVNKSKSYESNKLLADPFIAMTEDVWKAIRPSMLSKMAEVVEIIDSERERIAEFNFEEQAEEQAEEQTNA
jgi:hypothetical protein